MNALAGTFLIIPARGWSLALPASAVRRVLSEHEWPEEAPAPADLDETLGVEPDVGATPRRVLVLGDSSGEVAVRVRGALSMREVDPGRIWPLPIGLLGGRTAGFLEGIVLEDGAKPVFVIDARRVTERRRSGG